ncbi:MAG: mechanosensitive ion channel family protein [Xenococcus sp. (in: cyanobacteria)]
MNEEKVLTLNYLSRELVKLEIILQRPAVQIQILGLLLSALLALVISQWIWIKLKRRFPKLKQIDISRTKLSRQQYSFAAIRYLLTPTLCLVIVSLPLIFLRQWGGSFGYLVEGVEILVDFWFYRLFLLFLYVLFPLDTVIRYRNSLFAPLFFLFIVGRILNWFLDLQDIAKVSLLNLFGKPVTLEAIFVIIAGFYFLTVTTSLLEKIIILFLPSRLFPEPKAKQAISIVFRYFVIGIGIVIIFGYIGVNPTAFAAITGGLSVGIGFGLKEVISNFVSGVWLLFEGSLKIGDIILFDGEWSQVTGLGIRATKVKVIKNNFELIIPNQTFFTQQVSTLTGSDSFIRSSLQVGASYGCNPQQVQQLLEQVAQNHPQVLKEPAPQAFFVGFGESSLDFDLRFWLDDPMLSFPVTSELGCLVWQAFANNGIEIPYPQRDLHIRSNNNMLGSD